MSQNRFDAPLDPALFAGRQQAIETTARRLNDGNFSSTSVVGGPRAGKTSLLRYLANECADRHLANAASTIRVYVDVEMIGSNMTPFDFWIAVLRQLRSQVKGVEQLINPVIAKAESGKLNIYDLEDLFDGFNAQNLRIVLLVDNWDSVLRNAAFWPPASNFLHLVRYYGQGWQRRVVAWVLASKRPLLELWDPGKGASPYYNIFETVAIAELADGEVQQFTQAAYQRAQRKLDPAVERLIERTSCGHPYLLNFVMNFCLETQGANAEVDQAALLQALAGPNGPLVSLIQQIRGSLSVAERQLLDTWNSATQTLTASQKNQLATLGSYGLLPPRPRA